MPSKKLKTAKALLTHLKRNFGYLSLAMSDVSKSALANQKELGIQGTQHTISTRSRAGMSVAQQALADMLEGKHNAGTELMAQHWWAIHRRAGKLIPSGQLNDKGEPILREETEEEKLVRWEKESNSFRLDYGPIHLLHEVKKQVDQRGTILSGSADEEEVVDHLPDGTPIYSDGTRQDESLIQHHLNLYLEHEATRSLFPASLVSWVVIRTPQGVDPKEDARRLIEFHFRGVEAGVVSQGLDDTDVGDITLEMLVQGDLPLDEVGRISLVTETDHGMELVSYQTAGNQPTIFRDAKTKWVVFVVEGQEELLRIVENL